MNIYIFDLDDTIVKHNSLKIDYNDYKYDPEFLKLLEKCKCDKKYIFTNGTDGHAKLILNNMGISNVFDFIFSRTNNISMKPILSSYVYVQNKIIEMNMNMNINQQFNDYFFFDDQLNNLSIAKDYMGWKTIWIHPNFLNKPDYIDYSFPNIYQALLSLNLIE